MHDLMLVLTFLSMWAAPAMAAAIERSYATPAQNIRSARR